MEEVPDMDDLLDEMESDLMRKVRISQPAPLLPPTSIGMQPRGFQKNPPTRNVFSVSKLIASNDMNEQMEGHINIDPSQLPNTFQPKKENLETKEAENDSQEIKVNSLETSSHSNRNYQLPPPSYEAACAESEVTQHQNFRREIKSPAPIEEKYESEPEPEDVSETEEDTLIPETQIISNINATDRDMSHSKFPSKTKLEETVNGPLDSEMESMMDYLNGFDEPSPAMANKVVRKPGGRESFSDTADESLLFQFADKLSEELVESALNHKKLHYDPAIREFYTANDSAPDVFAISLDESQSTVNSDTNFATGNYISETENEGLLERMPSVTEDEEAEDEEIEEKQEETETVVENNDDSVKHEEEQILTSLTEVTKVEQDFENEEEHGIPSEVAKFQLDSKTVAEIPVSDALVDSHHSDVEEMIVDEVFTDTTESENVVEEGFDESVSVELHSEACVISNQNTIDVDEPADPAVPDVQVVTETAVVESVRKEDDISAVEVATIGSDETTIDNCGGDAENDSRPRFDSTIADVHVLHESDSDDAAAPRRERRLTESELQLGKTPPYWIPDSECPLCMLCNSKFTIITRRHHCRACGRVLCGSCCNEKAVLEYLQEEGKKPQAVRVCKPCFAMLNRIEAHQQEENRRRESVTSETSENVEDSASTHSVPAPHVPSVPRGVLKSRATTQNYEQEGASSSSQAVSVVVPESSRRSVMFRDGVRPGAPAEECNREDERSTALKPKKKSRKRQSVVKRIAELKMEEELLSLIPDDVPKVQVLKPGEELPKYESASIVLDQLRNFTVVTIVIKKNLKCTVQIFNNPNFGLVWVVATHGFAQIGLDEILFSWTLSEREKQRVEADEPELSDSAAMEYLPIAVLNRIANMFARPTDQDFAGVRRVCERHPRIYSAAPEYPLPTNVLLFRPSVQVGLDNMSLPTSPFLIACFILDEELAWATALPNRLLYKLGEKYNVFPTPFVNAVGRSPLFSTDFSGTVLKVFTDFRSWSYRMRSIPGCTVSLTNEKTIIRIPKSSLSDLKEVLSFSRSMVAWSCDFNHEDDSILVCEETDPALYSTQVFAKYIGQRQSTSASFIILDGGSKVNALQVNVVEDGVSIRLQSERLETILNAIHEGHDVVETSKDMEFRVEFVEDGDWLSSDVDYNPKSQIDGLYLMNKFQYGLSLERVLTQTLQISSVPEYEVRLSHVYNLGEGRLTPEEEPRIYGMVEIAAKECVSMLEPHVRLLIVSGIWSVSIRLFVSQYEFEYDVSKWTGLEKENIKYRQSLDQLIPMLYNMIEFVPSGFEVEFVLSFVNTKDVRL